MTPFTRRAGAVALALSLAVGALVGLTPAAATAADPVDQALARLGQDADRALTIRADGAGPVAFVGVPARAEVDNPAVKPSMSPGAAADAALARYGAAVGSAQDGTTLERTGVQATATGDVAHYQQEVDGVPVLGGQVVVSLRDDGELSSMLSRTTDETSIAAATVSEDDAATRARAAFVKASGAGSGVRVDAQGRWLLDAGLIGGSDAAPARAVWRFEVSRAADERRMILVDDRTGGVVMDVDLVEHAVDRVVCDNGNVRHANDIPCTSGFARTEGGPASGVADVNTAYDLSGVVADFYQQVAGVDLTQLLGLTVSGQKKLASTVRWCYTTSVDDPTNCPYDNAFWNGSQMYYGEGYAGADDVVGHEMTHGFTERNSGLFYWGQSGAMNESISDIIGEIIDHRHGAESDADWELGEDVPGYPDGLRNMKDPTLFDQPDKTSSSFYEREGATETSYYPDQDGVHTNSGVGNHTFYLISQGGTFNGQTITGIDAGDPDLTRSAKLWLLVDQSLSSGSDWADEADVLDQSCQSLLSAGTAGFTAATCDSVHRATLATELRSTPVSNPQPTDAQVACPSGSAVRSLFDSESGTPDAKFTAGATWGRGTDIAHSGAASWVSQEPETAGASSLTMSSGVPLPAGQPSYLFFQRWQVLDYFDSDSYDAMTVQVDDTGDASAPFDAAALTWVNGPSDVIFSGEGNPAAGRLGFGGDSRGYVASRVDLSSFAGKSVAAQFTMNTDSSVSYVGLALDDVQIYTCDAVAVPPPPSPPTTTPTTPAVLTAGKATISGTLRVGKSLAAKPGRWQPSGVSFAYQWLRNGKTVAKATKARYRLTNADRGKKMSVRVTGSKKGYATKSTTSKQTVKIKAKAKKHRQHR